ncbi:hypothetical protein SAMN05216559_2015 [Halomicrobium zhouii]|uniref:Uncharacterized protein n=1 Tax=Halomicrobium zhouii TaxID=767519 RepID=A0A1I6L4I9_9EURY|nr:DUF6735 family protein [Halomicrobium zhouii]SFR98337.1 hypothetical protein SAMN05216559_2015 [Halomicrobium zhouii]
MGHRALVAYRQPDGTFTLRYAHWGERLDAAIGPTSPLGGPAPPSDTDDVATDLGVERRNGYEPPVTTRVDPRPLDVGVSAVDVLDAVDGSYESLVRVSQSFEATAYLVCSLDPTGVGNDLVLVDPDDDPETLRGWYVETRSRLSAAVADGTLTPESARATLRRALSVQGTLYPPDDASFLRDG